MTQVESQVIWNGSGVAVVAYGFDGEGFLNCLSKIIASDARISLDSLLKCNVLLKGMVYQYWQFIAD